MCKRCNVGVTCPLKINLQKQFFLSFKEFNCGNKNEMPLKYNILKQKYREMETGRELHLTSIDLATQTIGSQKLQEENQKKVIKCS